MTGQSPQPGEVWRYDLGSVRFYVTAVDERFVYVKRADEPKKSLARAAGSQVVARGEFAESWRRA